MKRVIGVGGAGATLGVVVTVAVTTVVQSPPLGGFERRERRVLDWFMIIIREKRA